MKYLNRISFVLLTSLLMVITVGCSTMMDVVVESAIDAALETPEEREIRKDYARLRDDKPLEHHRNERDLISHDLQETLWDDDEGVVHKPYVPNPDEGVKIKREFPLPGQILHFASAPGTFRVVFYNDTNIEKYPASRIGIKIDGKGVESLRSGQYVQLDLPRGEYKLELIHRDLWDIHRKYRLKVEDKNVYLRLFRTTFSSKFKSSHEEPVLLHTAFKPIASNSPNLEAN